MLASFDLVNAQFHINVIYTPAGNVSAVISHYEIFLPVVLLSGIAIHHFP